MANKKCLVFETLGSVKGMNIMEAADGYMRLHGVFGVCGVKNNNNRVYNKKNYGMMVEALQKEISQGSVYGELEHPQTMNITLENVSHMIESIEMNDDGTVTGTIKLLDTPKGKIAQAIAKASGSLYISSRGAGSIDNAGNVTLTTIKTYDLVGTPGFSQAKLSLAQGQKFESLNESLEGDSDFYAIILEEDDDDLLDTGDDDDNSSDDNNESDKKDSKKTEETNDDDSSSDDNTDDNKNNDKEVNMNDLKDAIDKLASKVEKLEADLHIAQESLDAKDDEISALYEKLEKVQPVNYAAIEEWVTSEFAPEYKESIMEEVNDSIESNTEAIAEGVQKWVCEEYSPVVQDWVCEEYSPVVQDWVCEEFAPVVQDWICEEYSPVVQNWVCEEFAPVVEGWINEELVPVIDKWICEEFAPEMQSDIVGEVNCNVSAYLESRDNDNLNSIDNLLTAIENNGSDDAALNIMKEAQAENKFRGIYVVENMPAEYQPSWNMLSEARQNEIIRTSRMYDFTKGGILENFWANVDFSEEKPSTIVESVAPETNYFNRVADQMRRFMH